jgi:hypothetical protein
VLVVPMLQVLSPSAHDPAAFHAPMLVIVVQSTGAATA